ncbi:MAG: DUF1844 domain-containing protein [Thermoanaerobaculum sp.]|nr:DUF1844 domain-containing protein [Thermoanaerobaculum sp.]
MSDEAKTPKTVKVIDRRWFTPDGELRQDLPPAPPPTPAAPQPSPQPQGTASGQQETRESGKGRGTVHVPNRLSFFDLVDFFAQQALALLSGQIPGRGRDPDTARYFIDLLGVVQEKSTGQLTPEEARYLDDVLFQLRALYVQSGR